MPLPSKIDGREHIGEQVDRGSSTRSSVGGCRSAAPIGIEPVHMLAAFASEEEGLMGRLKRIWGFDAGEWRAALVHWTNGAPGDGDAASGGRGSGRVRELLSPDDAADLLGVHTQTVRNYIRSGKLRAHRIAGERAIRIRRRDLLDLLEPYEPE